jgi:hypothetical protein
MISRTSMTFTEFLVRLRATPREWRLLVDGHSAAAPIRRKDGDRQTCPICAVAGRPGGDWASAAEILGLPLTLAAPIAGAADDDPDGDPLLREAILHACGL